jgi:urease subunit alpha
VRVRLADSALEVEAERDDVGGPDEIVPAFGGTMRDGLGVRAGRGGVELCVLGGLLLDPVLGVRRASLGISDGRIVSVGRAGNPDTMDGIDVVLDAATAIVPATGMLVTPGAVDSHVHWLSPQVADAALGGGTTTLVIQDLGPMWNLGTSPGTVLRHTWAALEHTPVNAALLVRGSASSAADIEAQLRAGGAGLKIHEDVGAGAPQILAALEVAERCDVQLAIHTDGLNEVLLVAETAAAFGGRTVHAFHIEGAGGGHSPDLLALCSHPNVLTSSTSPTVPFGRGAVADNLAMIAAVHEQHVGGRAGDREAVRARARAWTMAAEGALHDLGVIPMVSSDSQGMGRVGQVLRTALQNADALRRQRGSEGGRADNERVLRHVAKATINPAITHGLGEHVGSLQVGRLADAVLWRPEQLGVRPETVLKQGIVAWGASGLGDGATSNVEPVRVGPQVGSRGTAPARCSVAFLAGVAMDAELPTARERLEVRGCRGLGAADMVRNTRRGVVEVDPVGQEVRLDGERVAVEAVDRVAFGPNHLIG